jgi:hypothetical protein
MKRIRLLIISLAAILAVASFVTVYFSEASVYYSLKPYVYQEIGDNWYTFLDYFNQSSQRIDGTFTRIECQNKGLFDANFKIIIKLTNATFSKESFLPSEFADSNTVTLSYNLHSQEKTYTDLDFSVNNDTMGFIISMQFQTKQPLIRHSITNWGGQTSFPYGKWENNTWAPAQIS